MTQSLIRSNGQEIVWEVWVGSAHISTTRLPQWNCSYELCSPCSLAARMQPNIIRDCSNASDLERCNTIHVGIRASLLFMRIDSINYINIPMVVLPKMHAHFVTKNAFGMFAPRDRPTLNSERHSHKSKWSFFLIHHQRFCRTWRAKTQNYRADKWMWVVDGHYRASSLGGGGELLCILRVECNTLALFNAGEGGRREFYVFSGEFLTPMNYDSDFFNTEYFWKAYLFSRMAKACVFLHSTIVTNCKIILLHKLWMQTLNQHQIYHICGHNFLYTLMTWSPWIMFIVFNTCSLWFITSRS
jgi:hypothetical protein